MATAPAAVTDLAGLAALRRRAGEQPRDEATMREVARQFEAVMTQQVLKSARAASLGDEPVSSAGLDLYKDMFDQQMAQQMSAGRGLGLADMLVAQLRGHAVAPPVPGTNTAAGAVPGMARTPAGSTTAPATGLPLRPPLLAATNSTSKVGEAPSAENFVRRVWPQAEAAARELGLPTEAVVGQAALETGWGQHQPGGDSHNFFGIKADRGWGGAQVTAPTTEVQGGRTVQESARFRAYGSAQEGFADYARFLRGNPRYAAALQHGGSVQRFAEGLQQAGYATDPQYAQKLLAAVAKVVKAKSAI